MNPTQEEEELQALMVAVQKALDGIVTDFTLKRASRDGRLCVRRPE
jgi:hypothetical protein